MTAKKNNPGNRLFMPSRVAFIGLLLLVVSLAGVPCAFSEEPGSSKTEVTPEIGIAEDIGGAAKREAARGKKDLEKQARSLFEREPLGWDLQTCQYLYSVALSLLSRMPTFTANCKE
ncbi:MAG: hypothetical protein P8175_19015 [Deltaproteobacteria bacterium]